jgi:hypothetical protein
MMYHQEESSLFDQALSSPLIVREKPKRWSWTTASSTATEPSEELSTEFDTSYRPPFTSTNNTMNMNVNHEEITFEAPSDKDVDDDLEGRFVLCRLEEGCLDHAILRERRDSIQEINASMLQINQIQKGK